MDKYDVSWQIVPTLLLEIGNEPRSDRTERVLEAVLKMKRPIIENLRCAYEG